MHYAVEVAKSVLSLGCMPVDQEIGVLFPAQEDTEVDYRYEGLLSGGSRQPFLCL